MAENRWAMHVAGVAVSRGKINVVADASLSPTAARAYARRILAATEDAERQLERLHQPRPHRDGIEATGGEADLVTASPRRGPTQAGAARTPRVHDRA